MQPSPDFDASRLARSLLRRSRSMKAATAGRSSSHRLKSPGTSGFVGEFLTLIGAFKADSRVAALATLGVILSAGYALYLYRRVIFGALEKANLKDILDLNAREIAILAPLVLLTIFFGVYPSALLDVTAVSVKKLVANYELATKTAELLPRQ